MWCVVDALQMVARFSSLCTCAVLKTGVADRMSMYTESRLCLVPVLRVRIMYHELGVVACVNGNVLWLR